MNSFEECSHPNLKSTARTDYCPDCGYEFYYGDAHAKDEARETKLVNRGRDAGEYGIFDRAERKRSGSR